MPDEPPRRRDQVEELADVASAPIPVPIDDDLTPVRRAKRDGANSALQGVATTNERIASLETKVKIAGGLIALLVTAVLGSVKWAMDKGVEYGELRQRVRDLEASVRAVDRDVRDVRGYLLSLPQLPPPQRSSP